MYDFTTRSYVSNFIKKLVVQGVNMTIKLDNERLQELAFVLGHMAQFHLSGRSKGICQDLYSKISKLQQEMLEKGKTIAYLKDS